MEVSSSTHSRRRRGNTGGMLLFFVLEEEGGGKVQEPLVCVVCDNNKPYLYGMVCRKNYFPFIGLVR